MYAARENDTGMTKKDGAAKYTSVTIAIPHRTVRDIVERGRSGRIGRIQSSASPTRSQIHPIMAMNLAVANAPSPPINTGRGGLPAFVATWVPVNVGRPNSWL